MKTLLTRFFNPRVRARVVPTEELTAETTLKMFDILDKYYDGVSWETFLCDLSEKSDVILLEHAEDGICGFSTLLWKKIEVNRRTVLGVFSGDTILEYKHWGSPALGIRFLIYLWVLKIKNPFTPVYWFLMSKGYKTYLLMANNFSEAYPDFRKRTPAFEKSLMDVFYAEKFGKNYDAETGVIRFQGHETAKLKTKVAPIHSALRHSVPRIAFFEHVNPNWSKGEELACVALMTLTMPLKYLLKKVGLGPKSKKMKTAPHLPMGFERRRKQLAHLDRERRLAHVR